MPAFDAPSRLRLVLNTWSICNLPAASVFPRDLAPADTVALIRDAGYEGLQMEADDALVDAGLAAGMHMSATGRVIDLGAAEALCEAHMDRGFKLTTLHVGTGFETRDDGRRLMDNMLNATSRTGYPLYVETHRATLTQDPRRTLDFVETFPELRFNLDISHWYAGCEMPYGDLEAKLAALRPVFDRTRYVHGRLADSSCLQVPTGSPGAHTHHFLDIWTRVFAGFLSKAAEGQSICFAPELLPNTAVLDGRRVEINYARLKDTPSGPQEETDRWLESGALCAMAVESFRAAEHRIGAVAPQTRPIWKDF